MRFRALQLEVSRLGRAKTFYSALFGIEGVVDQDTCVFDFGGSYVFLQEPRKSHMRPHATKGVALYVDDFEQALARGKALESDFEDVGDFHFRGPVSGCLFNVTDPDGNSLSFYKPGT